MKVAENKKQTFDYWLTKRGTCITISLENNDKEASREKGRNLLLHRPPTH
ncbi:hypothetical protein SDC9_109499 [bioreactor metagenome]|uniref:Uncharacterized protein n=1 Tax=bioreactor metagenome TaxID=1076179 RepID=A0A645BHE2_9ZZZZ